MVNKPNPPIRMKDVNMGKLPLYDVLEPTANLDGLKGWVVTGLSNWIKVVMTLELERNNPLLFSTSCS
eukprot:CAMPEP_0198152898 /NCGR_PEP_ID=MMETSP1443-20131203/61609_1 /TAXON_ID=186043 /ORGANISM="Entomoneis sp., Strain CCMP2396" /LENGTH=67 /DNA_ID=CAMNT_0043819039 /DNA_START=12 /DNA_END=212 /DNA_ORIENTATION=+